MITSAQLSNDGLHRYELERLWEPALMVVVFIMLNPSTADAMTNDPTILRCINFSEAWGFGGIRVVNLVTYRTKSPEIMYTYLKDQNASELSRARTICNTASRRSDVGMTVAAWGKTKPVLKQHIEVVERTIRLHRKLYCIKQNLDGSPAHPLYQKSDSKPQIYLPEWLR